MKVPAYKITQFLAQVSEMRQYMQDEVIYEPMEGQPDHFSKLPKAEQLALGAIYLRLSDLASELIKYKEWFSDSKNSK